MAGSLNNLTHQVWHARNSQGRALPWTLTHAAEAVFWFSLDYTITEVVNRRGQGYQVSRVYRPTDRMR